MASYEPFFEKNDKRVPILASKGMSYWLPIIWWNVSWSAFNFSINNFFITISINMI